METGRLNKIDKPRIIEKRVFTCCQCRYSAQVYGEQYFDYGTRNYIITFNCLKCKILFEGIISKMECWEFPVVTRDLADEVICLWCGTENNRVWSKENAICPVCGGKMTYSIEGIIKVAYNEK